MHRNIYLYSKNYFFPAMYNCCGALWDIAGVQNSASWWTQNGSRYGKWLEKWRLKCASAALWTKIRQNIFWLNEHCIIITWTNLGYTRQGLENFMLKTSNRMLTLRNKINCQIFVAVRKPDASLIYLYEIAFYCF